MLAVLVAPNRRHRTQSNRLPRKHRRADRSRNKSRHLAIPRTVARISRPKIDGHVSPGLFAAQSQREKRSLERLAKSHGRSRPRSEERQVRRSGQVLLIHHGNFAGPSDGSLLGRLGFSRPFRHPPHWRSSNDAVYAVHRIPAAHNFSAVARWLGPARRWVRLATMGLGRARRGLEFCRDADTLSRV